MALAIEHSRPFSFATRPVAFGILGLGVLLPPAEHPAPLDPESRQVEATPTATASCAVPKRLTAREARADLLDWLTTLRIVHPAPNAHYSAEELDAAMRAVLDGLPSYVDVADLYRRAAPLAARLGDAHTSILPPRALRGCYRMPFVVAHDAFCSEQPTLDMPAGSCVESIAGLPAEKVLGELRSLASSETAAGKDWLAPDLLPALAFSSAQGRPLRLVLRAPDGSTAERLAPAEQAPRAPKEALSFDNLAPDVARLTLRTLTRERETAFARAFGGIFAHLEKGRYRGLVIDLRDNDGGSTSVGDLLLSCIASRPYRTISEKRWRVSRPMQGSLRKNQADAPEYLAAPEGAVLTMHFDAKPPLPCSHPFGGLTVFLIGPGTLSAAMMLADAVQTFKLGLLVGEPTSSPPTFFAEAYETVMPSSRLAVTISTAAFVRASGDANDTRPVQPDIPISSPLEQRLSRRDAALDKARQLIEAWSYLNKTVTKSRLTP